MGGVIDALIAIAACLAIYPALVLVVAITGPHNETEIAELAVLKAERRRMSPTIGGGGPVNTLETVKGILSGLSGKADILDDDALRDPAGLALDSLDCLEATMQFEEAFNIEIPDRDSDRSEMGTPAGIARYLNRRMGVEEDADIEADGFVTVHP